MKVEQQGTPKFVPVQIVLETQEEVDALYSILGMVAQGSSRVSVFGAYVGLEPHVSNPDAPLIRAEKAPNGLRLKGVTE